MGMNDTQIDVQRNRMAFRRRGVTLPDEPPLPILNGDDDDATSVAEDSEGPISSQANPSSFNQEVHMANSMKPDIYRAVTTGDIDAFEQATEDREGLSLMDQVTPQGNTVLHLAAIFGYDRLVELIITKWPDLLWVTNVMANTALHVAANAGNLSTVKVLVRASNFQGRPLSSANIRDGNNPLHMAIKSCHKEVAKFLVEAYPEISCCPNEEHKSPLCLAAETGWVKLVELMIQKQTGEIVSTDPVERSRIKSLVHAAITGKNIDILDAILSKDSTLIDVRDDKGRNPLSYASSMGYLEGVQYFLNKHTQFVYQADQNGFFPAQVASVKGYIAIIEEFLQHCPDSIELLNSEGQNILHVAAMSGKYNVVSYMLKSHKFENLINERDADGNTPLHLATMNWHPKIVTALTWDNRVSMELVNIKGLTALDAAEKYMGTVFSFRKRLTWKALRCAGAPRAQLPSSISVTKQNSMSVEPPNIEKYKDRVNTLLLVSTLVATVTFAAGFTMPGGYNSSGPHQGMATLVMKHTFFHTFIVCDTIAMYSSIIVAVALIWAQLGDPNLIFKALKLAMPLLGVALTTMSIAFMSGVYLAVSNLTWLANVVLIVGIVFIVTFSNLFVPLYFSNWANHPIIHYILYYPFWFLILATTDDDVNEKPYVFCL